MSELRRRNVFRVAIAYVLIAWVVLEVGDVLAPALHLPEWVVTALVFFLVLGFPVALVVAWAYELTPEGLRREKDVERSASITSQTGRKLDFIIITALVVAVAYFVSDKYLLDSARGVDVIERDSIAAALSAVNEVDQAIDRGDLLNAYMLTNTLPEGVPADTRQQLLSLLTVHVGINSEPSGATVSWRPYDEPETPLVPLGTTPLEWDAPREWVYLEFELDGHATRALGWIGTYLDAFLMPLRCLDDVEPYSLKIPGGTLQRSVADVRLTEAFPQDIEDYLIDRFEVTNQQFEEFVRAGGYEQPQFWEHPFERDGEVITFEEAMREFVDATGRPGPANWAGGTYPVGKADHPVTGVSWYEAAAYANFVGRELPTVFHWYRAAAPNAAEYILPFSNFDGVGTAPVGTYPAVSPWGVYDMAGNAREWVVNAIGDLRITLGGGWNDPWYSFLGSHPQPPFDRSVANGFRLMTNLGDAAAFADASRTMTLLVRDFYSETPVDDEVFSTFLQQYEYDAKELNAVVEAVEEVEAGIRERITFDAGYTDERMVLYLFRPAQITGPLQTVVIFPGAGALRSPNFDLFVRQWPIIPILVRSGRAVAFPIYRSTFERQDGYYPSPLQNASSDYRNHVFQWRQDLGRSLDYLETRPDIDKRRFAFFGNSWGGTIAPIMLAVEPRFRAAILGVSGLTAGPTQPIVDEFNFLPRVRIPVLMVNGEYDHLRPLETSARPFYDFLGVTEPDKRLFIAPGGHVASSEDLLREAQSWLDKYLGSVR